MNVPALLFMASVLVACVSTLGLIASGVFATLLRRDATAAATFLSFSFLAATLGVSAICLPILVSLARDSHERTAYFATWQPWLFIAALLAPHLLWFPTARRPIPAAAIATIATSAATPEFLSIIATA